jgi:hypothetical protein
MAVLPAALQGLPAHKTSATHSRPSRRNAEGGLDHPVRGDGSRQVAPANWCSMSPGLEHSLSAPSLIRRRRCLRHNTGSRSHFPNRIPQTARHVVVGHLIERHRIHWWRHPREARPFDRRCVNDCACLDQSRSYRPARPRNLVFHRGSPFCCRETSTSLAGSGGTCPLVSIGTTYAMMIFQRSSSSPSERIPRESIGSIVPPISPVS